MVSTENAHKKLHMSTRAHRAAGRSSLGEFSGKLGQAVLKKIAAPFPKLPSYRGKVYFR